MLRTIASQSSPVLTIVGGRSTGATVTGATVTDVGEAVLAPPSSLLPRSRWTSTAARATAMRAMISPRARLRRELGAGDPGSPGGAGGGVPTLGTVVMSLPALC